MADAFLLLFISLSMASCGVLMLLDFSPAAPLLLMGLYGSIVALVLIFRERPKG